MLVWEKMRRELGLGERSDHEGTGERTRGRAGCAHPASLAVRRRSATAGRREGLGVSPTWFRLGSRAASRHRKWPGGGGLGTNSEMGFRPQRWLHGQLRVPIPRSRKALAPCGDLEPQGLLCIQDQEAWV